MHRSIVSHGTLPVEVRVVIPSRRLSIRANWKVRANLRLRVEIANNRRQSRVSTLVGFRSKFP